MFTIRNLKTYTNISLSSLQLDRMPCVGSLLHCVASYYTKLSLKVQSLLHHGNSSTLVQQHTWIHRALLKNDHCENWLVAKQGQR